MSDDAKPSATHHYSRNTGTATVLIADRAPEAAVGELPSIQQFGSRPDLELQLPRYTAPMFPNARIVDVPFLIIVRDGKAHITHDLSSLIKKA